MTRFGWKSWIAAATVAGALVGLGVAARTPRVYRSEAIIRVAQERPTHTYGSRLPSLTLATRMQNIRGQIRSRTSLQYLLELYPEERRHVSMEAAVERTMQHVEVTPLSQTSWRIAFTGSDPRTVMQFTERLAGMFIAYSQQNREVLAEEAAAFFGAMLTDTERRLALRTQQWRNARRDGSPEAEVVAIEAEVLQATRGEMQETVGQARLALDAARLHEIEPLELVEPVRVADRPSSPDQRIYAGVGATSGFVAGLLLLFVTRRLRSMGQPLSAEGSGRRSGAPPSARGR
jgi:hypothetical protein